MKCGKTVLRLFTAAVAALFATSCGTSDADKTLTILYWQAPTIANPYLSGGSKDTDAAALVLEPLASYDENGNLVPRLADIIPTLENKAVSEDLTQITWRLREGVRWSDGTPLTKEDVVFTYRYYCSLPASGPVCDAIEKVEPATAPLVRITFAAPTPYPYTLFVGAGMPILQKAQFENCLGEAARECREENLTPVGTGPYRITNFAVSESGDSSVISYEANEHFRAPERLFSRVVIRGGGDAVSTARAVLEAGEADYASNLQVDPQTLKPLQEAGKGTVKAAFSNDVESLFVNFTNPDPELGARRSEWEKGSNPHPFLNDPKVRQALSMAIDRGHIAEQLYGTGGKPTCNIISAPERYASSDNDSCLKQDIEGAKALLEEAGWLPGEDGIRKKEQVRLEILYQTSTNSVRQETQKLIQQWWLEIGVETDLKNINPGVFFGGGPGSPDTLGRFYADIQMFTRGSSPEPQQYLSTWRTSEITGAENNWQGGNINRWSDTEYDSVYEEMEKTRLGPEREKLVIKLNNLLVKNHVGIPLVHRASVSAVSNALKGVKPNAWDSGLWNIHEWHRE